MTRWALTAVVVAVLGACGDDSNTTNDVEVVVSDASLGGAMPVVIGATAGAVSWSASPAAGTTLVGGSSLATLPVAAGTQLATASGPVAPAGDFVVFAAEHAISRVGIDGAVQRLTNGDPEALGAGSGAAPVVAWSVGPVVSWGADDAQMTATLNKIDRCDHARVTSQHVYVACDGASGRRLLRIDQDTAEVTPITASSTWAPMFPGGGAAGATYRGRIAGADDTGVLWLVEEMPSKRGIVVFEPLEGEPSVLLEHLSGATGFFVTQDALYWQEGDALLTSPRAGGAATIVAELPGAAGALAEGYVYFANGIAIERLPVD